MNPAMEISPGGFIKQDIVKDPFSYHWDSTPIGTLKIRVVDPTEFARLTASPSVPRLCSIDDRASGPAEWARKTSDETPFDTELVSVGEALPKSPNKSISAVQKRDSSNVAKSSGLNDQPITPIRQKSHFGLSEKLLSRVKRLCVWKRKELTTSTCN